ncbi:radical SAM protein [Mycolicibacterium sp.]|uniref:radical SAM protein n=1 Tax=Mycolicibacterium sp. TaxID=2320850 RepID=UPI003D0AE913
MLTAVPIYISWNYTYACNFNCSHCYSRAGTYPKELDTSAYFQIVEQFTRLGVMRVGLGGGEPLIRRDCVDVLAAMGSAHIDTNITTNAWFVNDKVAARLAAARLATMYVSLDSASSEKHDSFRRKVGSYDRVVSGIRSATNAGIKVKLSTVITTLNFLELADIVRLAEDLGIYGIEFKRFRPTGNGNLSKDILSLPSGDQFDVQATLADLNERSPLDIALFYNAESDGGIDSGCPCGIRSLTLRPNGDLSPCAYAGATIGKLPDDDLGALWRESPALVHMRSAGSCAGLKPDKSPSGTGYAPEPRVVAAQN